MFSNVYGDGKPRNEQRIATTREYDALLRKQFKKERGLLGAFLNRPVMPTVKGMN